MTDRRPAATPDQRPRLLFLDAYDSFTNNIIALLRSSVKARVTVIKIDDAQYLHSSDNVFHQFLRRFDGVVVGPGPGDPHKSTDTGLIEKLWRLPDVTILPVLGICLGFQSLVLAFGGTVSRLKEPRHGIVRPVRHCGRSLFDGVGEIKATQYHSLHGRLGHNVDDRKSLWSPASATPDLEPLAWDFSDDRNGPVLMGVRHAFKPYWGVQYHPESICTNTEGAQVVENWWREARIWRAQMSKASTRRASPEAGLDSGYATDADSSPSTPNDEDLSEGMQLVDAGENLTVVGRVDASGIERDPVRQEEQPVIWRRLRVPSDQDLLPSLRELVQADTGRDPLVLESGTKHGKPVRAETGRFSILGFVDDRAETFKYWTSGRRFERHCTAGVEREDCDVSGAFDRLKHWTNLYKTTHGPADVPFWGGLIGYVSYEAGLETINVEPPEGDDVHADLTFVFVRRSIVVDHVDQAVYVQALGATNLDWVDAMSRRVESLLSRVVAGDVGTPEEKSWKSAIYRPRMEEYCEKVKLCQSRIRAGDSYELCLTDQSTLEFVGDNRHPVPSQWELYSRLRSTNPAPFGAFLDFEDVSILSSSPERFLSWSRDGVCEFRPIKGTVQKGSGTSRKQAEEILKSEKEQAENLMIVDLIRHDLNGIVGQCGNCALVPKLMQVEEYATVYQLVSVIQGQLKSFGNPFMSGSARGAAQDSISTEETEGDLGTCSGLDVLQASLPPGSMTGAPKKRSCEILRQVEGSKRRRIYSGVLGYLDVGGGGDFSVVIRSAIRYNDGWRVGAGGAVTALSDSLAEYHEMMGKSMAVQL